MVDDAESCPEVLGLRLSIVLCKLVGDKLLKAREEGALKALRGKDVVVRSKLSNDRGDERIKLHQSEHRRKDEAIRLEAMTS